MTGRVGAGEVMRHEGVAGFIGARLPALTRRLRPVALSCPSPLPFETVPAGLGAVRVAMAEISAASPASGSTGPLGSVRQDVRTDAPCPAAEHEQ